MKELLKPWVAVDTKDGRLRLEAELRAELSEAHVLAGRTVTAIARRTDCDDVLFALDEGRYAVVHLTWSAQRERQADWPRASVFDSLDDWKASGTKASGPDE